MFFTKDIPFRIIDLCKIYAHIHVFIRYRMLNYTIHNNMKNSPPYKFRLKTHHIRSEVISFKDMR